MSVDSCDANWLISDRLDAVAIGSSPVTHPPALSVTTPTVVVSADLAMGASMVALLERFVVELLARGEVDPR